MLNTLSDISCLYVKTHIFLLKHQLSYQNPLKLSRFFFFEAAFCVLVELSKKNVEMAKKRDFFGVFSLTFAGFAGIYYGSVKDGFDWCTGVRGKMRIAI